MKKNMVVIIVSLCVITTVYYFYATQQCLQKAAYQEQSSAPKMRKFIHNKLWRDKGVERMEKTGSIVHVTILDDEQYDKQLGLKLLEEAHEVCGATSKEDLISEVGDVLEVLDCIITLHDLSRDEIEKLRIEKREERGSLLERKFVTITESIPGTFLDEYCSKDPNKYQLIVD
jgi:predicted house-cleaning noncanonical NTP pyrophosphatase (MazG superfamily)